MNKKIKLSELKEIIRGIMKEQSEPNVKDVLDWDDTEEKMRKFVNSNPNLKKVLNKIHPNEKGEVNSNPYGAALPIVDYINFLGRTNNKLNDMEREVVKKTNMFLINHLSKKIKFADKVMGTVSDNTKKLIKRERDKYLSAYKKIMNLFEDIDSIDVLNEGKPGLWDNIRAKRERGEKPAHPNSKAYKDAVKAGKKIKKQSNEQKIGSSPKPKKIDDKTYDEMPELMSFDIGMVHVCIKMHEDSTYGVYKTVGNSKSKMLFKNENISSVKDYFEKVFTAHLKSLK